MTDLFPFDGWNERNGRMTPRRTLLTFEEERKKSIVHFQRLSLSFLLPFFHLDLFFLLLTLLCLFFPLFLRFSFRRFFLPSFDCSIFYTSHITQTNQSFRPVTERQCPSLTSWKGQMTSRSICLPKGIHHSFTTFGPRMPSL